MKPNRLSYYRKLKGLSQQSLGDAVNTSKGQIYQLETGQREINKKWRDLLAPILGCDPLDLIRDDDPIALPMISVLGYVGAGEKLYPVDDHAMGDGLEEVECPPGSDPRMIAAVRVRGDSMLPKFEEGEILYYSKQQDGVPTDAINRICIVKLANDGMLVKKIRPGTRPELFHLFSMNNAVSPIWDAEVVWASKVTFTKPA